MKKRISIMLFLTMFLLETSLPVFAQETEKKEVQTKETKTEIVNEKPTAKKENKQTSTFSIGEIVVRDQAIANIEDSATTSEISSKQIESRSDKTLADALTNVPGINVIRDKKGKMIFTMRGLGQENVATFIDGIPMQDIKTSGGGDLFKIPIINTSRIVITRGVSSALYGTLGSSGAINVISKKPEKMFTQIDAEYGILTDYNFNLAHGAPIGDFYYWITSSVAQKDSFNISGKLDKAKRREWFDKLVQYNLYGKTFSELSLTAATNYLNDVDKWNHTESFKYQIAGKAGYNITKKIETGISASYYSSKRKSNSFQSNSTMSYDDENQEWNLLSEAGPAWKNPYTSDGKSAIFANRAFVWPEDHYITVSPYFNAKFDKFSIKGNIFYVNRLDRTELWMDQDEDSAYLIPLNFGTAENSEYDETSIGINLLPSYKINSWNKISFSIIAKNDFFQNDYEPIDKSSKLYTDSKMSINYYTLGIEDQMKFETSAGDLSLTAGVSYDTQDIRNIEIKKGKNDPDKYELIKQELPTNDSILFGTRDSLNPVVGFVYDPVKDLLKIRSSFGIKTKFPSMSQYKDIVTSADTTIKPERSYNGNVGLEFFFLDKAISLRADYFYSKIDDKILDIYNPDLAEEVYSNLSGIVVQGAEIATIGKFKDISKIMDIDYTISYVFTHSKNLDTSSLTKGERLEDTPTHQLLAQINFNFISETSVNLWGNFQYDQIQYVMAYLPTESSAFTRDAYTTVQLNNPIKLNIKVSQKLFDNFTVYAMCKNILDDYNTDPFNPGSGRTYHFGGSAKF